MRRLASGVLLALLALHAAARACSCAWSGPFLTVASSADVIVHGRVLRYHGESRGVPLSMDVEIRQVLRGEERLKMIRIWGDNGAQCRPYASGFPIGTEWVWAIDRMPPGTKGPYGERPGDYAISVCGAYWLRVEGGDAIGHLTSAFITDPEQRMGLGELLRQVNDGA